MDTATHTDTDTAADTAERYASLVAGILDGRAFVTVDECDNDELRVLPDLSDELAETALEADPVSFTDFCCDVDRWGHLEVRTYGELIHGHGGHRWSATHSDLVIGNVCPDLWVRLEGERGEVVVYRDGSVAARRWVAGLEEALEELADLFASIAV